MRSQSHTAPLRRTPATAPGPCRTCCGIFLRSFCTSLSPPRALPLSLPLSPSPKLPARDVAAAGVSVDALERAAAASGKASASTAVARSATTLLVKNLPFSADEVRGIAALRPVVAQGN